VIGKNGEVLFDSPKPTAGCSANGRRGGSVFKMNFVSRLMFRNESMKGRKIQIMQVCTNSGLQVDPET